MKHRFLWDVLGLLFCMAVTGCDQPPTVQVSTTLEPAIEPSPTIIILAQLLRLPIIKNGSGLTPTPFLPFASTPVILPTQAPEPDLASQFKSLKPDTAAHQHRVSSWGDGEISRGGVALLKDTIRYNLGIRIDKLAIVGFDG